MDNSHPASGLRADAAPSASPNAWSRPAAMIGGGLGVFTLGAIAAAVAIRTAAPEAPAARSTPISVATAVADKAGPAELATARAGTTTPEPNDGTVEAPRPAAKPAPVPAPTRTAATPAARAAPAKSAQAPSVCTRCGVVESVTAIKHKGEGTGLGAVTGGVLGGIVGHQIGGGKGRDAMTVIGAVGGGVAGHEVEKRARATTHYQVRVRMNDGSLRSVTQSTAPTVGQRVTVNGQTLQARG